MNHKRVVTEADFRLPEFRTAKLEDYELRPGDDKPVRKDRWQTGILLIASSVGLNTRQGFEVSQVVEAVDRLTKDANSWEHDELPVAPCLIDVRLDDGSVLLAVACAGKGLAELHWHGQRLSELCPNLSMVAWREAVPVATPNE
jgi:hypothetical protein